jgi:hypothetical protein
MQVQSMIDTLNNEIQRVKDDGRNKLYMMNLNIEDDIGGDIVEILTKYYHSKLISIDVHRCKVRNQYDLMFWW